MFIPPPFLNLQLNVPAQSSSAPERWEPPPWQLSDSIPPQEWYAQLRQTPQYKTIGDVTQLWIAARKDDPVLTQQAFLHRLKKNLYNDLLQAHTNAQFANELSHYARDDSTVSRLWQNSSACGITAQRF